MRPMGRPRKTDLNLPPRMRRKGNAYYYAHNGTPRRWEALGTDFAVALRRWAELAGQPAAAVPQLTFSEVATKYRLLVYPTKAPRTRKDNDGEFKKLEAVFGRSLFESITHRDAARYHALRGEKAPVRANREIALLSHVWTFARSARSGYLTEKPNPCEGIERFKEAGRDNFVTDDVFLSIVYKAPQPLADAMWLAYFTGQRPSDVLKVRRDNVRELALDVRQGKTGANVRLELAGMDLGKLVDELLARERKVSGPWLIQDDAGQRLTYWALAKAFAAARKAAAEAARAEAHADLAGEIEACQFRDLRAKSGTEKAEQAGIIAARDMLGHASVTMTEHYVRRRRGARVKPLK